MRPQLRPESLYLMPDEDHHAAPKGVLRPWIDVPRALTAAAFVVCDGTIRATIAIHPFFTN